MTALTVVRPPSLLLAFLVNHPQWPTEDVPVVMTGDLVAGFDADRQKGLLILPDGGPFTPGDLAFNDRFTLHYFGPTKTKAFEVATLVSNILLFSGVHAVALNDGNQGELTDIQRIFGPSYSQEPEKRWHRWISAYQIEIATYQVPTT